jgi:hypothetical protein
MSQKVVTDFDLDNVARVQNALDPLLPQDYVTLAFLQSLTNQYNAEAVAETSTTSDVTESTKVTLVTPSLPLGDYILEWSFRRRANAANKRMYVNIRDGGALLVDHDEHFADSVQNAATSMRKKLTGISGVKTYTLNFRADTNNTTVYMSEALVTLRRIA